MAALVPLPPLKFDAGSAAPEPAPEAHRTLAQAPTCAVFLAEVKDVREDRTNLGYLSSIPIEGKDSEGWIVGGARIRRGHSARPVLWTEH